jgi:hypothetical protein
MFREEVEGICKWLARDLEWRVIQGVVVGARDLEWRVIQGVVVGAVKIYSWSCKKERDNYVGGVGGAGRR